VNTNLIHQKERIVDQQRTGLSKDVNVLA
jgi:hypothetical protein